jgi:hypothetical protein
MNFQEMNNLYLQTYYGPINCDSKYSQWTYNPVLTHILTININKFNDISYEKKDINSTSEHTT